MRKISLILVAVMLLSAGNLFANDVNSSDPSKSLSNQIGELLDDNPFIVEGFDLVATIKFTLNGKHEIVILDVQTKDPVVESFMKARLNYQKVDLSDFREGRLYTVPVRITG